MAGTDVNRTINAPFEKVWEVATDLKRWEEWNTLFTKWKSDVPESLAEGTQVTAVLTIMGMANTITLTVDAYNPPKLVRMSGTGMAGMECIATNLLEPGDEAIVCVNGVFGGRMKDVMERCGATVHALEAPWGEVIPLEQLQAALAQHRHEEQRPA